MVEKSVYPILNSDGRDGFSKDDGKFLNRMGCGLETLPNRRIVYIRKRILLYIRPERKLHFVNLKYSASVMVACSRVVIKDDSQTTTAHSHVLLQ
jgi:hypothetical protein